MDSNVDMVVYGQGERTFSELVDAFAGNKPFENIAGLCYKSGNAIVKTAPRLLEDINNFPPIPLELIDVRNYIGMHEGLNTAKTLSYMSSQGCPYRCGFCADKRVYQRRWFGLRSERVINDITSLVRKYNLEAIYFEDNNFFVNKKRVAEICSGILKNSLNIKWEAMGHPRQLAEIGDDFWRLIKESGCRRILIGAESGDQKILNLINKDSEVADTIRFVQKAKKHGIIPILSTLVGFPTSGWTDMKKTISMVVDIKREYRQTEWKLFIYTPYPGTDLYEEALRYGLKQPENLAEWSRYTLRDVKTPWVNDKFRTAIRDVAFFYFHIAYPSKFIEQKINNHRHKFFILPVVRIAQFMARIRLRFNFYFMPFEPIFYRFLKRT
jgi:radical SAM superfamily enzyme YgiQ (UPF0313 family)